MVYSPKEHTRFWYDELAFLLCADPALSISCVLSPSIECGEVYLASQAEPDCGGKL